MGEGRGGESGKSGVPRLKGRHVDDVPQPARSISAGSSMAGSCDAMRDAPWARCMEVAGQARPDSEWVDDGGWEAADHESGLVGSSTGAALPAQAERVVVVGVHSGCRGRLRATATPVEATASMSLGSRRWLLELKVCLQGGLPACQTCSVLDVGPAVAPAAVPAFWAGLGWRS